MEDGGRLCLIFRHRFLNDTPPLRFLLSAVHCVYDIRWTGQPRALGGLRITHYGRLAGRKSWLDLQFDNEVLCAFLGMIFGFELRRWNRNRRDIVIVAFCSRRYIGLHLAFVFLAQLLFRFIFSDTSMIPCPDTPIILNKNKKFNPLNHAGDSPVTRMQPYET
jgi:hypothetical protein